MKVPKFLFLGVILVILNCLTVSAYGITQIAVSQTDTTSGIYTYDLNGDPMGSFGLNGYVADIEYDSSGNLYSFTSTGLWKYDGTSNTRISSIYAPTNIGGDIALSSGGVIAVSQMDTSSGINFFDIDGSSMGSFGANGYVADIEYDSSGNLYSFTSTGLWKYDGTSNTRISSITASANRGGDIAIVPEPISSTLFIVGGIAMGFRRFRKKFNK